MTPTSAIPGGLSATVITLNEEKNIRRCLTALADWVDEIILVDSGSQDATLTIASEFGDKVRVFKENWHGYGAQKNLAMDQCRFDWVLNVDADEVIPTALKDEILGKLPKSQGISGFRIARKTFYQGQWIQFGGWYPNYLLRLCQKERSRWTTPPVHEELEVSGEIAELLTPLLHYTFDGIADQVKANTRYAKEGARKILAKPRRSQNSFFWSCLLKLLLKPIGKFIESYFFKQGFRDGLFGFFIAVNAGHSMFMKFAFVLEDLKNERKKQEPQCIP